MATQGLDAGMHILDELVHDAEPTPSAWRDDPSRQAVDRGMTILSETVLDAATPDDPVQTRVEELARLILTSANPVEVAARVQTLLRDRLAQPTLGSPERP